MKVEFSVTDLATVAGCGAVTLLLLQIVLKPLLNALMKGGKNAWLVDWQPLIVNLSALVISTGAAFAATALAGITYENALQAVLTGLGGTMTAIAGFEGVKSFARASGFNR